MQWLLSFTLFFNVMKIEKSNPVKTVLVLTVGIAIIGLISSSRWVIMISVSIGILSILSEYFAEKIDWIWMKLASLLGLIIPNILLSIIFFLLLWPLASLAKLFGSGDLLSLKNSKKTLFKTRYKSYIPSDFEKLW